MEPSRANYFLVIFHNFSSEFLLFTGKTKSKSGMILARGGGNETHSHLERARTPTRTTLGFFETEEKEHLTKYLK